MVTGICRSLDGSDDNNIRSSGVEAEIDQAYNVNESVGKDSTIEDIADDKENSAVEIDTEYELITYMLFIIHSFIIPHTGTGR